MMRRFAYTALCVVGMLCALASCQNDELAEPFSGTADRLTARKSELLTRSVPPNSYFPENTRYRLWAYDGNGSYLFDQTNGVLGKESVRHYVEMEQQYAKLMRDRFVAYGFTDGASYEDGSVPDNLLPATGTSKQPQVTVSYDSGSEKGYPDYLRAHLDYDRKAGKTSSVLEFKHILSRIRVQVIQQGKKGEATDESIGLFDLKLHEVAIEGVYNELTYDIREGKYEKPADGIQPVNRTLKSIPEGKEIEPTENGYLESYILPTSDMNQPAALVMKLVISGEHAGKFSNEPIENDRYIVSVALNDRMNPGENGAYDIPLVFEQNCAYMLRMVFAEDGIILFTPMVYPWFDGETDGWEDGEGFEEQALGNTMLFDNLIWSDRNLGAEDFLPASKSRYEKCTGFFYQFGRNIPYFPMVNNNGVLTDNLVNATSVYPVVSHANGRLHGADWNTDLNHFILKPEDINEGIANNKSLGYATNGLKGSILWSNVEGQPVPPGWRLPTQQEFFGIMPTTPHAGNITFLKNLKFYQAGNIGHVDSKDFYNDNDVDVIYIHVPNDSDYPNYPSDDKYEPESGPTNGTVIKQTGDPYGKYHSEYLISRRYDDETGKPIHETNNSGKSTLWGTIYGIKKVGTNEAYRMRWRVERAEENTDLYYLVIERFTATAKDRLSRHENDPNYYRKFDWTRPVAVLYLPINGIVGDSGWEPGKFQIFGKEVIFATSEEQDYNSFKTFRIKIGGTVRNNQFIFPAVDRKGTGAQIRLVRESTYQPNRQ
ncbi:fimbrillin family protein [Bacteroides ovatus]|uniref:fimbrillin family protein n=1 Tax=Bacteroides ovatus TaxID=28116 RepID=UPI001F1B6BF7|nr:fimbrillin family protein [Bacteroides ovatus]